MNQTPDPNVTPGPSPTPAGPTPPGPMGYQAPPTGPMGYMPPPPMPPNRGRRTGLVILGVLGIVVIGIVVILALTRDLTAGSVTGLQVGDCMDEPAQGTTVTQVQHQPCTQPHDGEVFAALTHPAPPGEAYPVVSGFDDYIEQNCIPLWETYTGRTWATDTELTINYLHPTITGWGDGDRGFTCYTTRVDDAKLHGSVRGVGASTLP